MWRRRTVRAGCGVAVLLGLFSVLGLVASGGGAELWPAVGLQNHPAEQAIMQALEAPTTVEFFETSLPDVLAFLQDQHHIPIDLDKKSLAESGLEAASLQVTKNLKRLSLRSCLRLILDEFSLTYSVEHEVLRITSREAAEAHPQVRVYQVGNFAVAGVSPDELGATLQQALTPAAELPPAAGGMFCVPPETSGPGHSGGCPAGGIPETSPPPPAAASLRILPLKHTLVVRAPTELQEAVARLLGELAETL